jgi:hypothetical protein
MPQSAGGFGEAPEFGNGDESPHRLQTVHGLLLK